MKIHFTRAQVRKPLQFRCCNSLHTCASFVHSEYLPYIPWWHAVLQGNPSHCFAFPNLLTNSSAAGCARNLGLESLSGYELQVGQIHKELAIDLQLPLPFCVFLCIWLFLISFDFPLWLWLLDRTCQLQCGIGHHNCHTLHNFLGGVTAMSRPRGRQQSVSQSVIVLTKSEAIFLNATCTSENVCILRISNIF